MRKLSVWLAIGFVVTLLATVAHAQEFPTKPLRMLVPYPPGSGPDVFSRTVGNAMTGIFGQPVIIDNRPGAGGVIAVQELVKSAPDGYTLLSGDAAQWAIFPALRPGAYDPQRDMIPVARLITGSFYIIVPETFPAKDLREFVAVVKGNPGKFSYGSAGIATIHHLAMESFGAALGLDLLHVPFRGSPQGMIALMGGEISMLVAGINATIANPDKLRLIAGTAAQRSRLAPDVSPMADAQPGLAELDFPGQGGYFVPAGTPKVVIDKLAAAIRRAAEDPEVNRRVEQIGLEVQFGTAEQLADIVRADVVRYGKAVKIPGIKLD